SRWMKSDQLPDVLSSGQSVHAHDDGIDTFCLVIEDRPRWEDVAVCLDTLATQFGQRLLRVKGVLHVEQTPKPIVVQGVQGLYHPPGELQGWSPGDGQRSRIVFITDNINRSDILRSIKEQKNL